MMFTTLGQHEDKVFRRKCFIINNQVYTINNLNYGVIWDYRTSIYNSKLYITRTDPIIMQTLIITLGLRGFSVPSWDNIERREVKSSEESSNEFCLMLKKNIKFSDTDKTIEKTLHLLL